MQDRTKLAVAFAAGMVAGPLAVAGAIALDMAIEGKKLKANKQRQARRLKELRDSGMPPILLWLGPEGGKKISLTSSLAAQEALWRNHPLYSVGQAQPDGVLRLGRLEYSDSPLTWNAAKTGSLLVEVPVGSCGSSLLNTLAADALAHPDEWDAVVLIRRSDTGRSVRIFGRDFAGMDIAARSVLVRLQNLARARSRTIRNQGASDVGGFNERCESGERTRRVLVVAERPEMPDATSDLDMERLNKLVRTGRDVGVHVAAFVSSNKWAHLRLDDSFGARARFAPQESSRITLTELDGEPVTGTVPYMSDFEFEARAEWAEEMAMTTEEVR